MSYILDALRKAERQRHVSRVPTLDATHGDATAQRRPWPWSWAVSGAVMAGVVVYLAWTLGPTRPSDRAAAVIAPSASGEPVPVSPAPSPPPADRAPEQEAPARSSPMPAVKPPSGALEPARAPAPPARTVTAPPAPPVGRTTARPRRVAPTPPADRPVAEAPMAPLPATPAGSTPVEARSAAVPSAVSPAPEIPPYRPAHPGPAEAPTRLTLDVLVYSDAPAERLVFINGRKYVEGQAVDGETIVEQITPDGAILRRADRRVMLSPKLNPYARPGSP